MTLFDKLAQSRDWLENALAYSHSTHDWDDIVAGVYAGHFYLWLEADAAAILEVNNYPKKRGLNVFLAGGNLQTVATKFSEICNLARDWKCDHVQLTGRYGWARVLDDVEVVGQAMRIEV